jgi:hypothetical protein
MAVAASPALAWEEPWHGIRAADPAWCACAGLIGSHDPAPVGFSAEAVRGLGTACAVVDVVSGYENSFYVVTGACTGAGETRLQVDVLMPGEGDVMWRWTGAGEPVRLTRCGEG